MAVDLHHLLSQRAQDAPEKTRLELRFDPMLEQEYLRERTEKNIPVYFMALAVSAILLGLFLLQDFLTLGRYSKPWIYTILLGFNSSFALLSIILILRRRQSGYPQWVAMLLPIGGGVGLIAVSTLSTLERIHWPYELMFMNYLFVFFFVGLTFRHASVIALSTVAVYALFESWAGLEMSTLIERSSMLFMATLLCGGAGYLQEHLGRAAWLRARQLEDLAARDGLTGLLNHRTFFELAEAALGYARREKAKVAVLLADADQFKDFNDTHGHLAGDECLRRIAELMQVLTRRPLDIVGRIGGEEFALLFYGANDAWVLEQAEALRAEVSRMELGNLRDRSIRTSISIGVAYFDADVPTLEQALRKADAALYRAKAAGRNRVST